MKNPFSNLTGITTEKVMEAIALITSLLSKCPDGKQHGCVIAMEGRYIISTGYNGPAVKEEHCKVCDYDPKTTSCPAVHAEVNALVNAARMGISVKGAKAYVTKKPCHNCEATLKNAGIVEAQWPIM